MKTTRIILADDQLLIRAGIKALLESLQGYKVVAECADGPSAIDQIRALRPDVVLLDIAMPGPNGIEVARILRDDDPATRILILSSIDRPDVVQQALAVGVNGYLLKDFILDELQEALTAVLAGRAFLSPALRNITPLDKLPEHNQPRLTARQTEILRLVASGLTTKEIARELVISPKTVEFHRARLMERIGVRDVASLTRFALQSGLIN